MEKHVCNKKKKKKKEKMLKAHKKKKKKDCKNRFQRNILILIDMLRYQIFLHIDISMEIQKRYFISFV